MAYIIAKKNIKNGKVTVLTVNNVFVPIDEDKNMYARDSQISMRRTR